MRLFGRILKTRAGAGFALALFGLGGCVSSLSAPEVTSANSAARQIAVADQSILITGPKGYCIDPAATRDTAGSAFVLLGACGAVDGQGGGAKAGLLLASLTSSGAGRVAGATEQLAIYFASPEGRAALSRSGDAQAVKLLDHRVENDALYLYLRDTSQASLAGVAPEYWRGMFDVNGHIATVSVMDFAQAPNKANTGLERARAFRRKIRPANQK
ncbi:MAG: hypothetical protein ACJA06_001312 [Halocynthiibacter sp.]|jgi:hypothetical protein